MPTKPTPDEVRATARKVDAFFAYHEARERNRKRTIAIVKHIRAIPKKYDVMPDLVKRR